MGLTKPSNTDVYVGKQDKCTKNSSTIALKYLTEIMC